MGKVAEEAMRDWLDARMLTMVRFAPAMAIALGLSLALETIPEARAQVTIDVSKVTCDQYTSHKITNPQNIAIWLSGYYHGKRGDTTLETQALIANAKKVRDYCFRNPQTLVMNAVEKVLGGESR
jgi:acid stress chaperone HdeB